MSAEFDASETTPGTNAPEISVSELAQALKRTVEDRFGRVRVRGGVVLASGGFESNPEWRTRYLGPGWDLAKVRGTRYNMGVGIKMALDIGAQPYGHWSGCHAVGWDMNAPPFGDLEVGDNFQKHSYPLGIMVNANGVRFVDEGADFRNYTYAKYGAVILAQPQQFAWQIFDAKVLDKLRDEYRIKRMTKVSANTIEELAKKLEGVNEQQFLKTIKEWNAAVMTEVPFNPTIKDGRGVRGLAVPKSNWANPIDTPPFEAYAVTCGLTFTFGGLKTTTEGEVVSTDGHPIPGLYAAGELVGGLFYHNYPGGTGLVSGAVLRFEGQLSVFKPHEGGPCYRCLYPEPPPPGLVPSCAEGGVLGILPGLIGLVQATEAVKLLLGAGEPLVGRLLLYDALAMRFRELRLRRNPECPVCGDNPTIKELIDYQQFCGVPHQEAPLPAPVSSTDISPQEVRLLIDNNADFILVMSGGRLVEQGTWSELLRREGTFHALHRAQLGTYLRSMGSKVPAIYGGSADEEWKAA